MLEFLSARITLAKAIIIEKIDPDLANEFMINSYLEAKEIGVHNPHLEPGALALNDPVLLDGFQDGVYYYHYWENAKNSDF
jgi:hypothetical protein